MAIIVETKVNGNLVNTTTTATPTVDAVPVADGAGKLASGWGGAASSLATLDVSTKVPSAQMTGVLASSDLTNDAALEKTANKGAVSGYAALNGSSLVVQNPAAASASASPNIIPITDGTSGELDVGFVPGRVARWTKYTVAATAFTAAASSEDIELFSLPALGVIASVVIKHSTAFSGGTSSALTLSVGITGTLTKYAAAFDVFQAAGDTVFGFNELPDMENFGSTTSIRVEATATGDTLDNVGTGSADIWVLTAELPA